jgi:hypothetical protein
MDAGYEDGIEPLLGEDGDALGRHRKQRRKNTRAPEKTGKKP